MACEWSGCLSSNNWNETTSISYGLGVACLTKCMLLLRWLFLPVQVSCGGSENCLMNLKLIISTILMADDREIIIPILNTCVVIKRASRG